MAKTLLDYAPKNSASTTTSRAQGLLKYAPTTVTFTTPQVEERDHNKGGFLGGVGYTLGKFGTGAFSVLEGIWDFTAGGIADFFGADEWAEEQFANNIAAGWNQDLDEWYNPSKGMQMVGDVASGISNTLVGIAGAAAITYFTGGAAAPYAGTIAAGIMGVGAAGNATSEAYAKTGELGFKEYAYGALSGGTEMALEKFTGVTGKYATKLLGKETAKTVAKQTVLRSMWSDFKSEFIEEAISEFISPYYQRWTQVDPNAENATIQQIGYAGLVGGLSGALMGGIGTGISTVKAMNRGNDISKNKDYTNAVVNMAEKFAQYETDNNTGKEAYQYISGLVADFKARDKGTGELTLQQKKLLGQMEHANVVLIYEPEIQRSKEKIIANADDFAQYINSRNIIDGATGKPFRFANGAELAQNDALVTQFAVADALGQLMLTPESVYSIVSSKRTDGVMQSDFRNFQKNGTAEYKKAVNELFGIDVDGITYEDFISTIQNTDRAKFDSIQGGMAARASAKKAISQANNTGADIGTFDKGANIVDGTSVYKSADGKIFAVTKTGNGYYVYNGKDISKKLTKAQLLEVIDALNGVAPATTQTTETTAKTGQKTKKKPAVQTSPTGTQTAQETEKSKPKTAPKKKTATKKKQPATEKAKPTDKATQKREAIAKMRKSEDTTERVLAELYDNGAADYDAVSAMKDGQDLSTVDKVAYFATGTVKDYARQGLYTEKSLAKAIKEYADDIRAGKDVLVQVMDRAIELDGKQQPNWYKEQYHKAAEPTTAKKKTATKKTAPKAKETETTTAKPVKEKTIHGKTYKDFTVEEFNALSEPFRNYYLAKSKNPNAIVFVQLGDFYEAFFDDAKTAANEVELTLTGRAVNGYADRVEMVGFPIRFFDNYKAKLTAKGLDVVKVDLDGKKVLYAAKTGAESTVQYAISESATQETQLAGGKSQNLTPLQMKRAESFARTHVKGYENLTAAEKLEVEWTIASGWRYGASESDILSLAKISAQSGVGIGFADLKATTSDGKVVSPDAVCYTSGKHLTIYLNPKSKRTVEVATLHELTHALKGAKGYAELEKMALEYYAKHPEEKAVIDNAYRALYQNEQLRYEKEVLPDELTAHYIEKMLEKRNVLAQLTAEQPTFMQRCINWLKTRVDKLRGVDTQAADEVDILARKFVSTFNLNKGKIMQQDKAQYALGKTYPDGVDLIDTYDEKQYNNFGWARVNGVLSYRENGNFRAKYGEIKSGKQSGVHRTSKGEIIVETNDMEGGKHGVNNVLVFAKGSYEDYRITKVIRLKINNETELEKVRDYIYGQETDEYRKSYYQTDDIIGLLYEEEYITRHTAQDFPAYKQIKQSREKSGRNDTDSGIGAIGNGNLNSDSNNGKGKRLSGLDKSYLKLVEYGYMKTAQRMVDEEAKNAGYTIKAFHGSKSEFTFFDESKRGSNTKTETSKRWFFAADKKTANSYYPYGTMQKIYEQHPEWKWANPETLKNKGKLYSLYLKMDNPLIVDVADYDYAAHRETADAWMEFVEIADKNGNDGIILYNAMDNQLDTAARNSTVYMFRKSSQAKSADVVTYDNDGNVIPLSERFNSKKPDIRYALPVVDSDGKALSAAQQDYFKDSKVRDDKGRLLTVYHGSPKAGFTEFTTELEGAYFTADKNYATEYAKGDKKGVYAVYLNIKKPFDTREPAARKIFEKEFYGQWGNGAPLTARGLLDWTDGADMYDFIQEKGYDYDGIIIDEGGTPDGKGGVRDRGISYVAFHKNQIKNTTNVKPTKTNDIRYALSIDGETTPVGIEKGKNLVALHNLSEDKLLRVVELGGFPMPSIAVTTTELPHENYGDITVVFGRETVDPESDSRNVVYDRDAWTPTTPTVDVKLNEQGVDKLIQSLKGAVEKYSAYKSNIFGFFDGKYRDNNGDYIVSEYDYSKESFGERAIRNGGIVAAYLSEKGINVEPVYTERGFTMGWESFTREKAAELFDFVGITKDITRDNATQEQREAILEKFIKYRAKEKLGLMRRFKKDRTLTVEQVEEVLRGEYNDGNVSQLFFMAEDFFNEKRPKDIYDEYATLETLQSKITDKQDFYNWFWEKIEATFEKKGIDNGGDIFDRYGNRRSFEQRHYTYTAANIVKAMAKGDQEGKVPLGMTAGALAAKLSKRFDSIEDMHDAKQYLALVSEEDLKAFNDKTYELYDEVVTAIAGKSSDFMSDSHRRDDVGDILGKCAAVKPLTIENIKRKFASETRGYNLGYRFNDEIAEQTLLLFESLKHIPTTYFEAKPRRVVKLNEIKSVLLPESASEKLKAHLSRKNITWQVYTDGDNSRSKIIKSMDNARFALPLKGSDKVMTELPDERVTIKDVLRGRATKAELATQVKGGMAETSEAVKVLMTNAQAALERVLTENGVADATARTNYIRAGKYAAHNAIETQGGQYSLDGETRVGDSLGKIMQPIYKANEKDGKTYADFELYLLHYHNIDRMAVGKPVFGDDVTAADSQTAIAELDKEYPQFRKIAEKIWKFNDNNLQLSVDSGMYSQEYADTLREMYPHYVPTFREEYATRAAALMGKNNVWVNNAKKAAKGSSARILPIDDMMAAQTIQKTTSARINSLLVEMLERGDHDEFKVIATEDAEIQIDDDTQVTTHEDKTKNTHQVTFYHNGKKVTAQVSRLVFKGIEAFRASSDMSDNVALNAVAKVNSTFKKLVTSLNPFFSFFKNPIRDMQDALLYTRYSHREYLKNYNRARQEIAHNGHYWQEAKAAGITAASVYDYQKGIEYKQNDAGAKVKRFWGKLESASNAIEMAPRMAEYISAREAGLSVQEALLQAQDVTTNFGRGGTFAKKLNSTVMPFLNPAIQGFSKMWRSYTGENGKKAWVNLIIRSLILGIGATALNDLLNGDDEEYENLSDYVKEQNYVIALGGGDFLKIPKGRVIGVFGNAFLRGKRYAQGETDAWEGYFDSVMSSVTPVENFTRTIFSPITDAQTNTTWYGGAIESQKWNDTEPKNRYDESTSKIAIWLGSVFNYSPLKIDYLLEQYTGIVGDLVLPATSTQAESGIITQNMLVNSTTNSKWSTKFYSTLEDYTYKKTAGDLQAKGAVRYLNSINSTVSDMYNKKRTIQADKTLSNDEKLTQTKIIQAAINTLMQEAIGNAEYIYGEMGKYNLADDDVFDQAYLDSISVVMGEEYALKSYNKDVYEKATKINKLGIDYATYYDFYFGVKNITSDKKADGSTVAGSKKAKVINYVMAQNLSTAQKLVLIMAQGYSITDGDVKGLTAKQAKTTVAKYITSLNLTREEKTELAEMLGFTVKNGKIYFN